jgi:hypothetical protein
MAWMNKLRQLLRVRCLQLLAACGMVLTVLPGYAAQEGMPEASSTDAVWRVEFSPWTHHYRFSEDHKDVWALGLERETPDHAMYGLTAFSNSFGQPSAYAYYGHVFNNVSDRYESLYLKLTVGIIYGYKVPFEDKVLLNYNGFSPAIIPAVGWHLDNNWSVQTNFLGTAAIMFMVSRRL